MVTEPEQPKETPVVEGSETPVVAAAGALTVKNDENDDVDDTKPLTVDEVIDAGRQVAQTAKHAVLRPLYRLGRSYIRSARKASESFFDGVTGEKRDK